MGVEELHDPGFIAASVQLQENQNLDEAKQILIKTIENLVKIPGYDDADAALKLKERAQAVVEKAGDVGFG